MYQDIRHNIKTGDMFFTWDNSLLSKIIRFFTNSNVSHVGLFLKINDRVFTVECIEGKGCVMTPASVRLQKDFIYKPYNQLSEDDIINDVGRIEYDWIGAITALFVNTGSAKKYCSEWVAEKHGVSKRKGVTPAYLLSL